MDDGDQFGWAVSAIGDLDGDGVTDIAVGAPQFLDGGRFGVVHILRLNADGTVKSQTEIGDGLGGLTAGTLDADDLFGSAVTSLGDLDGDGITDIAVGAAFDGNGEFREGAVYVLLLNADGTVKSQTKISDGLGGLAADSIDDFDFFGSSVANIGDLDGDGVTDIAVGAEFLDETENEFFGAVFVLLLEEDGTVKSQHTISDGLGGLAAGTLESRDRFGTSLASLGDVDGDGVIEMAVGARGHQAGSFEGALYVLSLFPVSSVDYGDAPDTGSGTGRGDYQTLAENDGPSHTVVDDLRLGANVDADFGVFQSTSANADDVDGALPDDEDGVFDVSDLVITAGTTPSVRLRATNNTGTVATLAGWIDLNGDGIFDNATERASVTVPDGTTNGIVSLVFPTVPFGFTGTTYARFRLSTDVDALNPTGAASDGEVEDYLASINLPAVPTVDSFTKISDGLNGLAADTLEDNDRFGRAVTSLGDLDGDGVTDLAVGASADENGDSGEGAVYVLLMNADGTVKSQTKISDGLGGLAAETLDGGDDFGSSVTSLGDLDGDGVTDIAVGARGDDDSEGALYILTLNADGTVESQTKIGDGTNGLAANTLESSDSFGSAVASLGDLDGDGVTDVVVGASYDENGDAGEGAVYVLLLNADGTVKSQTKISDGLGGLAANTLDSSDAFGFSVTSLGDLDGDGITDIAVGARNDENEDSYEGAVYVLLLNADGTVKSQTKISDGLGGLTTNTLDGLDRFGGSVASPGDLNGDGVNDLVVGAYADGNGDFREGAVYVLLLNADGTVESQTKISDGLNGLPPDTLDTFANFGSSVASLGDLDGDGVIDVAVGAYRDDNGDSGEGAVYILSLGSAIDFGDAPDTAPGTGAGNYETTAENGGPSHRVDATRTTLHLGASVDGDSGTLQNARANADDVDGSLPDDEDGVFDVSDLAITVGTTPTVRLRATNNTGSTATLAGWIDFNADGVFDNATERATVTVPDGITNGIVSLVFPTVPVGFTGSTYARFRLSTDAAALNPTGAASDGEVEDYVVSVTAPGAGRPQRTTEIDGPDVGGSDAFGDSVTSLGDLDGDGVTDIAVGAPDDGSGGDYSGAVYVLLLNADGSVKQTTKIDFSTANGPDLAAEDYFGSSVTSLGDLDGDGVTDIAVGAGGDDEGGDTRGAVHVLLLNADGSVKQTREINSSTANGPDLADFDFFGSSVTSLGDLDGDGVTDIAVGAGGDDEGGSSRGAVHVLLLNADGSVKQATEINSNSAGGPVLANGDRFGSSVTSLGDLDGDGVTDIAVGANRDDEGGNYRGAVHVLLLNADGSLKQTREINSSTANGPDLADFDFFGSSVTSLGDLDGDGVTDIAVGAGGDDEGGSSRGAVHVLLLNADGSVKQATEINSSTTNGPDLANFDRFGRSVTSLGDFDGDGVADIAVGASGDVDDRRTVHIVSLTRAIDYGDNPDTGSGTGSGDYQTLAANGGPSHGINHALRLGARIDADDGTLQNGRASADDVDGAHPDDEDGVFDVSDLAITVGTTPTVRLRVTNNTGSTATLAGWIDFDGDGVFDNATERATVTVPDGTTNGIVSLTFPTVPAGFTGTTYARFRLSTDAAALNPTGAATDGEVEDYVVTITLPSTGAVRAQTKFSDGLSGLAANTLDASDFFGSAVASLGDLDGDGVTDIAVGAQDLFNSGDGSVYVLFLNADGTVKSQTKISDGLNGLAADTLDIGDDFGSAVTSVGDLDGDGVTDIAVGAQRDENGDGSEGAVYILLLNADGTVKSHSKISDGLNGLAADTLDFADMFGSSVTSLGDFDGDGVTDIAVGASGDDSGGTGAEGALYVLMLNADGTVKSQTKIGDGLGGLVADTLGNSDLFGNSVAALGDLDGDGVTDVVVGARQDEHDGDREGAVYVLLLNADGTVRSQTKISDGLGGLAAGTLDDADLFGSSVTSLGDVDGDGVTDIVVGALDDENGDNSEGAIYLLLLNRNGTVKSQTKISDGLGGLAAGTLESGDLFGWSVASLGDLDGDGVVDVAVGAVGDDTTDTEEGAVYLLSLTALDITAPTLQSFTRQNPSTGTTNADTLVFRATFSEDVQNVTAADFAVTGTTATVTNVTMVSAGVYDITVSGGDLANLNGTVGLNLAPGQDITDTAGNALPAGEPATDETFTVDNTIVVDNNDTGYSETGTWGNSGLTGLNGSSTRFSTAAGSTATWQLPTGRPAGWYTLQFFNVQHPSNATNARLTVVHANGTEERGLSQRDAPNGFTTIGTFFFDGTTNESVTLRNLAGGVLRADAVRLVQAIQPPTVLIDNGQTGYTEFGPGWADSGLTGNGGTGTRFTPNSGSGFFYRPAALTAGWYTVELFNVQHPSNTTNARVTITHAGAVETRTLDQRNTANGFVTLGRFYFDGSATQAIRLDNLGGDILRADAIRLTAAPPPGPGKIDNGQTGYSEFGVWGNSGLTGSDGSSTRFTSQIGAGATWRPPANLAAGWYTLELYNVQHPTNTTSARITIKHAGNTITRTINPQTTPNGYLALGTFYLDGSGTEAVTIQNLAAGALRADALRIRATPPPAPVTIDNGEAGHSEFGFWGDSGLTGQNGSSTRFTSQTGAGTTYRPANLVAGFYVVEIYNVKHPSNTTNARVTIKHAGVTVTLTLDQRNSPNGYVSFGTFFFDGLGSEAITLQNLGGLLRADAVRLRSTQPPQAQTQQAAPGAIANSSAPTLSTGDLDSLIDDALTAWAAVGVDPSAFDNVRFAIGDLAGNTLGTYASGLVTIDVNAAGHGWFVDTTPEDDTEFTGSDSPAGFDLFTVLKHELGHHLGLADETDGSLLETELNVGERRHIIDAEVDLLADRSLVDELLYG